MTTRGRRAGAGVLAVLCAGQCINLALGQSMVALAMTGEQAVVTKIAVLSGVLKIVLSVVLGYLREQSVLPLRPLLQPPLQSSSAGAPLAGV